MREKIYRRNGKTVYWKVERTPIWHQSETTLPGRYTFQGKWRSQEGHIPCQNSELNQWDCRTCNPTTQIQRTSVDSHFQVLPTRRHQSPRIKPKKGQLSGWIHPIKLSSLSKLEIHAICAPYNNSLVLLITKSRYLKISTQIDIFRKFWV